VEPSAYLRGRYLAQRGDLVIPVLGVRIALGAGLIGQGATLNKFDVSVYAIRRRAGRRRPFEVRWRAAGRSKSKSFITRKLADSYRAELVRAARMGLDFDPLTGVPTAWNLPEPAIVTWYEEAAAYAVMKWPSLAAHSRASLAEALATVTLALTRPGARDRPDQRELRTVLYKHAFNPARPADPGSPAAQILDWAQQASLPVGCLSEPAVLRTALEALTFRLDGSRAAANTIIRKRVVLHGALGYAAEAGLLPDNPLDSIDWHVPQSSAALNPAVVASPDQVSALLDAVAAAAWTSDGTSYEQRGLKYRPEGTIRMVPAPPVLVAMLRAHHAAYGTAADGRLFRGTRGGPLSGSLYGRAWQSARTLALSPELAAGGLARRPYDLRHAALSLWLNAGGDPAQIAARAGNSVADLLTVYSHCIHGRDDLLNQQISRVLGPPPTPGPCPSVESQRLHPTAQLHGSQRLHRPRDGDPSRPLCVRGLPARPTDGPQTHVGIKRTQPEQYR
jgi:integrase